MEWKERLTKKEQENRLRKLKSVFKNLKSDDWEFCPSCKFFGMPKCELTCGVVMKHLHSSGKVSTDPSSTPLRTMLYGADAHMAADVEPAADISDFANGEG